MNAHTVRRLMKNGFNFVRNQHGDYTKVFSTKVTPNKKKYREEERIDHSWRQTNHIWSTTEIKKQISSHDKRHTPKSMSDFMMKGAMQFLYHGFNFITGYKPENPSPRSIEWRLIILESFAGVPGFIGAGFRHFYSLRALRRDHGMIFTLLEEAENERMHLLTCLTMFEANRLTRFLVVVAQVGMTPMLMLTYAVHPPALHRFVGYLEETAVQTYFNIITHVETEGTELNKAWAHLRAPDIAITYWMLPETERTWLDVLKRMLADEAHHRDVNHTFAALPANADNPFIHEHVRDFEDRVLRRSGDAIRRALNKFG